MCESKKWLNLLKSWELKVLEILKEARAEGVDFEGERILWDILEYNSMMFPGASEQEVIDAEERLDCRLPDSYRQFIQLTNGWRHVFLGQEDGLIFPVDQVALFKDKYPVEYLDFIKIVTLDKTGSCFAYQYERSEKIDFIEGEEILSSSLAISEYINNGIVLLVPAIVFENGEWEVWHIQVPDGIYRYDSFWSWMKYESERTVALLEEDMKD